MGKHEKFYSLIDEAINLELNVSDLYFLFHKLFPQDKEFWWQLTLEEKNHASLLRSGKEYFEELGLFPENILPDDINSLKDANAKIKGLIVEFSQNPPTRQKAFNTAFILEQSAGEIHFQKVMEKDAPSKMEKIFQELNQNDKDHTQRIYNYMKEHNIPFEDQNNLNFDKGVIS